MGQNVVLVDQSRVLSALANGIIPADESDTGAAAVNAGARLAEKLAAGVNVAIYEKGLQRAALLAQSHFAKSMDQLDVVEIHDLIGMLRSELPAFYKQLRIDVCAMYLSDPGVWQRIGLPGPSTATGGYPDFDQPQN